MGKRHTRAHMAAQSVQAREKRRGYGAKIPVQARRQKQAHTPGPWKLVWVEPPRVNFAGWMVKQDDSVQFPIAMVTETVGGTHSPQEANARLIAAAPDLRVALEPFAAMAQAYFDMIDTPDQIEFTVLDSDGNHMKRRITLEDFMAARAAIAKVEGRS